MDHKHTDEYATKRAEDLRDGDVVLVKFYDAQGSWTGENWAVEEVSRRGVASVVTYRTPHGLRTTVRHPGSRELPVLVERAAWWREAMDHLDVSLKALGEARKQAEAGEMLPAITSAAQASISAQHAYGLFVSVDEDRLLPVCDSVNKSAREFLLELRESLSREGL